ncbi:reprolysin-like metallopeptidase [Lutimonas vermicola]|uniref:Reprolysin-like metallopeptidase n=1 Tax=Lutimonas vermicola TaxID=414288 RepID=A0ABU9KYF9_9FLAO
MSGSLMAQDRDLWTKTTMSLSELEVQKDFEVKKEYQAFELKLGSLKNKLYSGLEDQSSSLKSETQVQFPLKSGELVSFWVHETAVMHPALAEKFPNNKSYSGRGVDDPSLKINFSINELGLHAMITDYQGKVQYIDPLKLQNQANNKFYQVYKRGDITGVKQGFNCEIQQVESALNKGMATLKSYDSKLRTYRLAMAVTGEYTQYHIEAENAQDKTRQEQIEIVMASITTAMTRINYLFEKDLAVRLQLVENNHLLIFFNDNSPYTEDNISNMLNQNQNICNQIIGSGGYDIGHVMGTMEEGGRAKNPSVCVTSVKAQGASGTVHPTGDAFYFDYVAHELGHQFGANHTFNGDSLDCGGINRNDPTAVEPGSGSTIMAYAGLCAPQNVQLRSDLYFHSISIQEIWNHISGVGESCAQMTELKDNIHAPTADAGADFIIPKGTAFKLVGEGQDADGDPLSYCWEQIDNQINRVPPTENDRIGALYRSYPPEQSNTRYLPALKELRNGALSTTWEVTPTVARELNFSVTVRDNNPEGGQVAIDQLKVSVSDAAGPFVVTSQNTAGLIWEQNSDQLVAWDVAGTDANGVDVSKVNILLSTDGGLTFPTTLVADTDNDGSESIKVPYFTAGSCYLMVEAVDNFFFALNQKPFSIGEDNRFCEYTASSDVPMMIPDNDLQGIVSTLDIEADLNIEEISITVDIEHPFIWDLSLEIESPQGTKILLIKEACFGYGDNIQAVFSDAGEGIRCSSSAPGISGLIKASELLSSFAGESTLGPWKLKLIDSGPADIGHLVNWGMRVCSYEEVLSAKEFNLKGFNLYPNPADESFQLSFDLISDRVDVLLYDALGRIVLQKSYQSNSLKFKERIQTAQLKAGLYFLKVVNGDGFVMERVLVR